MTLSHILNEHHIIRHVPWSKLIKDENDTVSGISHEAFKPRIEKGEKDLSASWVEKFHGNTIDEKVFNAVKDFRTMFSVKPKSAFAVGNVGKIKNTCLSKNIKIHIIHTPSTKNKAHTSVEVKNVPMDDLALLELLANEEAWGKFVLNSEVP